MTARNARSVSFTDPHVEIIEKIAVQLQISSSEAIRLLIDKGLEATPDIRLAYLLARRNELQASLESVEKEVVLVEKTVSENPIGVLYKGITQGTTHNKAQLPKSDHGNFIHFISRLGTEGALGRAAEKKIREFLSGHPEWFTEIPSEWQHLFNGHKGGTPGVNGVST